MDEKIDDGRDEDIEHEVEKEPKLKIVFVEENTCEDVGWGWREKFAAGDVGGKWGISVENGEE